MLNRIIEISLKNQVFVVIALIFVIMAGVWAVSRIRLDAIPDLSDVQVIIYTEYPGQAPQVIEDQVTYPITSKMLSVPFAKVTTPDMFLASCFKSMI